MKILIPSYNRNDLITTHKLFEDTSSITIIVHNEEQLKMYRENPELDNIKIVVSGVPVGSLIKQRKWVLENLVLRGEWAIFMDDNIRKFCCVESPHYETGEGILISPEECKDRSRYNKAGDNLLLKKAHFNSPVTGDEFVRKMKLDILSICEQQGINLYGTASNDNNAFRLKKYRRVCVLRWKCYAMKRTELSYDENLFLREEYDMLAKHLIRDGKVLRNDYLFASFPHFMAGGIGQYSEREERYRKDCKYLIQTYPGLFSYVKKQKYGTSDTELKLRLNREDQIEAWAEKLVQQEKLF